MHNIDRRLVELNEALLKLRSIGEHPDPKLVQNAIQALSGTTNIDTGPGNDTIIINKSCSPTPSATCSMFTKTIASDYVAQAEDCYIGVNSTDGTTIALPEGVEEGKILVIKLQMGPPVGNRKVTLITSDYSTIDGEEELILQNPWETVTLVFNDNNWYKI